MASSVDEVTVSCKEAPPLFSSLDARPGARTDAFGRRAHFGSPIQARLDRRGWIERRVVQDMRIDQRICGKIVVAVVQLIRDFRDHFGFKNEINELVSLGEAVDRDSRDWMLAQVDFIVEAIGNESLELGDEMRSNLLQLLLAIANLNEQIRRQASLGL